MSSDYLELLQSLPGDLPPAPVIDDPTAFSASLRQLLEANPTPAGRATVIQAATLLAADTAWSVPLLEWCEDATFPAPEAVIDYAASGIASGVFDCHEWFQKLYAQNCRAQAVLMKWGVANFDSFCTACDKEFVNPTARIHLLLLLLAVGNEKPYIPGTPASQTLMSILPKHELYSSILRSLLLDTGNQLFPIALRALFTAIPFAPADLPPHIPLIMVVLGRAIFWRNRPFLEPNQPSEGRTRTPDPNPKFNWAVETSAMEQPTDLPTSFLPERAVRLLLVTLYGGWPSNVIAFVRDPVSYLRGKSIETVYNVEWEELWPQGLLATRVGPMLRDFQLHSSLVSFTSATELADEKRWDKVDPSEFVSRAHLIAHSERGTDEKFDFMEQFQEYNDVISDMPGSAEAAPTATHVTSLDSGESYDIARLRRENQLLRLEAQFTDRIRRQYIFHIGRLHRTSLQMYSDEAEIHSLANDSKEQKKAIESLQVELDNQKAEASKAKKKHAEWGEGLRTKNEKFREEKRSWGKEAVLLRQEVNDLQAIVKGQNEELAAVKNERFKLQNQLTEAEPKIRHIQDYETRMKQMEDMLRLWDHDKAHFDQAQAEAELWRGRCYQLDQLLRALRREREEESAQPSIKPLAISDARPKPNMERRAGIDFYLSAAESSKKRAEAAERENLELHAEVERLRESYRSESAADRSFLWEKQAE